MVSLLVNIDGDPLNTQEGYSKANLLRGKPNSLSRGPVAGLLCVVEEDYTPTLARGG